jgi:hypothetical protein
VSELYWNTVNPAMRQILAGFSNKALAQDFYLAGGTALALQMGHRISVDLDFFSPIYSDIPALLEPLREALDPFSGVMADSAWGNLVFLVQGVRVGFYGYGYKLIAPPGEAEGMALASLADIGLMKLDALLGRASRKDFHDLYAICQRTSLKGLFELAPRKYPAVRDFAAQAVRHMVYFERADQETPVPLLEDAPWETVKAWFRQQAREIVQDWLGQPGGG